MAEPDIGLNNSLQRPEVQTRARNMIRIAVVARSTVNFSWFFIRISSFLCCVMCDKIKDSFNAAYNSVFGAFLVFCLVKYDFFKETSRVCIMAILLVSLALMIVMLMLYSTRRYLVSNDILIWSMNACVFIQWIFNIMLSLSALRSDWPGACWFVRIHLLLFAAAVQGMALLILLVFLCGGVVELLVRTLCCKLEQPTSEKQVAKVNKSPMFATAYRHREISGRQMLLVGDCLLCMQKIADDDDIVAGMNCGATHTFHFDCLAKYLLADQSLCPICGKALNIR